MSARIIGSLVGNYCSRLVSDIVMTAAEVGTAGSAYYLASGKWTKSATTSPVEAVCIKGCVAGGTPIMELVKVGDIIEADYTGTPAGAFVVGLKVGVLDANGANVDAATVTGGHLIVLAKDTVAETVQMIAQKNITCA